MSFYRYKAIILSSLLILSAVVSNLAQQTKTSDGSPTQRLDVARSKIDSIRRSLSGAISAFKDDDKDKKKDDKMATNGVWMIRKNLEPGSIAILPKEKTTSEAPKQMIPSEASVQVQSKKPPRVDNRQGRRTEVFMF